MSDFTFNISLSVLNHLGRNLYRSFITVLGEAISNSWDADANNVWVYLNREENYLIIKDDGIGMTKEDFQGKFLKIGYSKRKDGNNLTAKGRPFIGRKGIGKLALLSCAKRITIATKSHEREWVGGTIDNSSLDKAIEDDLIPKEYPLEVLDTEPVDEHLSSLNNGTIIYFDQIEDGITNTKAYLKKVIALYFRFSLIDEEFNIHFNDETISIDELDSLADNTQFLWKINPSKDPFVLQKLEKNSNLKNSKTLDSEVIISGFIASVIKPRHLKILTTDEKVGIDLFVNGRLREKNILKHIRSARVPESYLYGQIHCNYMDDETDRFTSSREGIVSDDKVFKKIRKELKRIIASIIEDWDKLRIKERQEGDSENKRISKKERKSRDLFNSIADDFVPPEDSDARDKIEQWISSLANDAQFNFASYGECFVSENLIRKYIEDQEIILTKEAEEAISKWKKVETDNKNKGNISISIRQNSSDLSYLSMNDLSYLVDMKDKSKPERSANLSRDADEYRPIRDGLAHTALLTEEAKRKLSSTYDNIKARLRELLNE